MLRRFLRLPHKTTKQYHNLTFIKNEEHAIIVTSTLYSQFMQFVTNKLHKLLRHPILSFQKEQSMKYPPYVLIFLLMAQSYESPPYIIPSDSAFQSASPAGTGAMISTDRPETGCVKAMRRACRLIPPSGLERSAPYFRSPLIGQPMCAN